jgi:uncharacterized protein
MSALVNITRSANAGTLTSGSVNASILSPVSYLVWYLTEACNLRCSYCYLEKQPFKSTTDVGRGCVDFLLKQQLPVSHLRFFGGEALLELDLLVDVASYARIRSRDAGVEIDLDLVTNGVLLNEEARGLLRILGIRALLSIDGGRETMAENRGVGLKDAGWQAFESNIRESVQMGIIQEFRMTVTPGQVLIDDLRFLDQFGGVSIQLATATNIPWTESQMEDVYSQVEQFYLEVVSSGRLPPLRETNTLLKALAGDRVGKPSILRSRFCEAGSEMLAVDTQGRFVLCHRMLHRRDDYGMGDLWSGINERARAPFVELDSSAFHHPICETCHARPYCPGSCMAANREATESLFYPEERHCFDLRAHVLTASRILAAYDKHQWPVLTEFIH